MPVNIILEEFELPDFGQCEELVEIPAREFERRIETTLEQMEQRNLDFLLVFADLRERISNIGDLLVWRYIN